MTYTLGTMVPLADGGYAAAYEQTISVNGVAEIELLVQRYDAHQNAIGSPVLMDTAFSNPISGAHTSVYDVELVAGPLGGFDVTYLSNATPGPPYSATDYVKGAMFTADGQETVFSSYDVVMPNNPEPIVLPLSEGGVIVEKDWSFWFFDATGKWITQLAMAKGTNYSVRDLGSFADFREIDTSGTPLEMVVPLPFGANYSGTPLNAVTTIQGRRAPGRTS